MPKSNCQFNGTGSQYFVTVFIHMILIGSITFGFYLPWAWVRILKLKASHTLINGKQVTFTGTGMQLLMIYLVQGFLTVITFGIYGPWALCEFFDWRAQNTFVDGRPSQFAGSGKSLFSLYLIHLMILPLLTFGIYFLLGIYRLYIWKEENTRYGGEKTSFGGKLMEFVKVSMIGTILNAVTLNVFMPWSMCMLYKWQISSLAVGDGGEVDHFPPAKINPIVAAALVIICLIPLLLIIMLYKNQSNTVIQPIKVPQTKGSVVPGQEGVKPASPPATNQTVTKTPEQPSTPYSGLGQAPAKPDELTDAINYKEEIAKLDEVIKKHIKNAEAFYNRGVLLSSKGDVEQAISDFTKAIELNKNHVDAYYNRGLQYVVKRRFEEALRDFDAVIKMTPGSADAICNRGNVKYRLGRSDAAILDYTEALKLTPDDPDLYNNRAIAYRVKGNEQNANKDAGQAERLRAKPKEAPQQQMEK